MPTPVANVGDEDWSPSESVPEILGGIERQCDELSRCLVAGDADGAERAAVALARRAAPVALRRVPRGAEPEVAPAASSSNPSPGDIDSTSAASSVPTGSVNANLDVIAAAAPVAASSHVQRHSDAVEKAVRVAPNIDATAAPAHRSSAQGASESDDATVAPAPQVSTVVGPARAAGASVPCSRPVAHGPPQELSPVDPPWIPSQQPSASKPRNAEARAVAPPEPRKPPPDLGTKSAQSATSSTPTPVPKARPDDVQKLAPGGGSSASASTSASSGPRPSSNSNSFAQRFAPGANVEYYSQTHGGWVAADVIDFDEKSGTYQLNIHPQAQPHKVRAAGSSGAEAASGAQVSSGAVGRGSVHKQEPSPGAEQRLSEGALVEYFSTTHNGWVPAVVKGFSESTDTYILDIQPVALRSKVRARASASPDASLGQRAAQPDPAKRQEDVASGLPKQRDVGLPQRPCASCGESVPLAELVSLECDHLFCKPCLRRHCMTIDFLRQRVPCPLAAKGCGAHVSGQQVRHAVGDQVYSMRQAQMEREDEELARKLMEDQEKQEKTRQQRQRSQQQSQHQQQQPQQQQQHQQQHQRQRPVHAGQASVPTRLDDGVRRASKKEAVGRVVGVEPPRPGGYPPNRMLDAMRKPGAQSQQDEQVRHVVGDQEHARRTLQADENAAKLLQDRFAREEAYRANQFECPLCFEKVGRDQAIELDCRHRLCHDCFKNYLQSKISEAQVAEDELVCPIPQCKTEITVPQVEGAIANTPLWDKFLQFRMNMWRPQSGSCIVECPTLECGKFVVPPNVQFVQCPVCHKEFCARCGGAKHPGLSCEEHAFARKKPTNPEEDFEELMREQQWRRCPVCAAPSERASGCNFMQCRSERCRKRTYWCYICGLQMPKEDHYSHYPRGPYEDLCNTPEHERLPLVPAHIAAIRA